MKLPSAEHLAARIVTELQPYCSRIEIAGSIRRRCAEVNDIDLVVIPSDPSALRDRVTRNSTIIQNGPLNLLVRLPNGFQLDIFIAHAGKADLIDNTPSNWGSILLCRTGSKEHNIKLTTRAQHLGYKWKTYEGIYTSGGTSSASPQLLASATEQEIFTALQMDYLEPQNRH